MRTDTRSELNNTYIKYYCVKIKNSNLTTLKRMFIYSFF